MSSLNILVIDDSAVMRAMVIKSLRLSRLPLGDVHQAGNGQEGLKILEDHWVDLLLVDLNMPVMTGEELIDKIRSNKDLADLPILVISTESNDHRIESIQAKGVEFIHKPFSPEHLGQTIRELTGVTDEEAHETGFDASGDLDF